MTAAADGSPSSPRRGNGATPGWQGRGASAAGRQVGRHERRRDGHRCPAWRWQGHPHTHQARPRTPPSPSPSRSCVEIAASFWCVAMAQGPRMVGNAGGRPRQQQQHDARTTYRARAQQTWASLRRARDADEAWRSGVAALEGQGEAMRWGASRASGWTILTHKLESQSGWQTVSKCFHIRVVSDAGQPPPG